MSLLYVKALHAILCDARKNGQTYIVFIVRTLPTHKHRGGIVGTTVRAVNAKQIITLVPAVGTLERMSEL